MCASLYFYTLYIPTHLIVLQSLHMYTSLYFYTLYTYTLYITHIRVNNGPYIRDMPINNPSNNESQRDMSESIILLNQPEISLYLPFYG